MKGKISLSEYKKEFIENNAELYEEIEKEVELEHELYKVIAALRKSEQVTQAQLAETMGVSQAMIGRFESGKASNSTLKFLTRIVDSLGYKLEITLVKK